MTSNRGLILAVMLCVFPLKAFSWGRTAHEAVALIAKQNLNRKAQTEIKKLLGTMTIDQAALWPDQIKRDPTWAHTRTYHYTDIPDGFTYWKDLKAMPKEERAKSDMVRALLQAEIILRDAHSSVDQKKWALMFMVHLMGDIHQPLHAGRPEDRGGNDIKVEYFGKKTNLHAVWDTYIIVDILKPPALGVATPDPVIEYLKYLRTPSKSEVKKWQVGYVLDWFDEMLNSRDEVYADAKLSNKVYQNKYASMVDTQVLKGSYRLAAWLNAIFDGEEYGGTAALELREEMAKLVGNPDSETILEPNTAAIKDFTDYSSLEDFCGHVDEH